MRGFLSAEELRPLDADYDGSFGDNRGSEFFDPLEKSVEFIHRAETVMGEISLLQDDLKDIWNEARDYGLDVAVLKEVLRRRKKSKHELEAHDIAVGNVELRMEGLNEDGEEYEPPDDKDFDL
jgi:uncharacterized protein (UPF0335 family)